MNRAAVCESIDVEGGQLIGVEAHRDERDWKQVDLALQSLAKRRSALDAEEARWIRAAARVKIWRQLGCVSLLDYLATTRIRATNRTRTGEGGARTW
jgi:hypothetical protein